MTRRSCYQGKHRPEQINHGETDLAISALMGVKAALMTGVAMGHSCLSMSRIYAYDGVRVTSISITFLVPILLNPIFRNSGRPSAAKGAFSGAFTHFRGGASKCGVILVR
jgi:hypothetical protein